MIFSTNQVSGRQLCGSIWKNMEWLLWTPLKEKKENSWFQKYITPTSTGHTSLVMNVPFAVLYLSRDLTHSNFDELTWRTAQNVGPYELDGGYF